MLLNGGGPGGGRYELEDCLNRAPVGERPGRDASVGAEFTDECRRGGGGGDDIFLGSDGESATVITG